MRGASERARGGDLKKNGSRTIIARDRHHLISKATLKQPKVGTAMGLFSMIKEQRRELSNPLTRR